LSDGKIRPTPIFLLWSLIDKYTGTKSEVKFESVICSEKSGSDRETAMTTKKRAIARIRRAERIVFFMFDVIVPIFARARELRRVA